MRGKRKRRLRRIAAAVLADPQVQAVRPSPRRVEGKVTAALDRQERPCRAGQREAAAARLGVELAREDQRRQARRDGRLRGYYSAGYDAAVGGRPAEPPRRVVAAGTDAVDAWLSGHRDLLAEQGEESP